MVLALSLSTEFDFHEFCIFLTSALFLRRKKTAPRLDAVLIDNDNFQIILLQLQTAYSEI